MWAGPDVEGRVYLRNKKGDRELTTAKVHIPEGIAMAQYKEPTPAPWWQTWSESLALVLGVFVGLVMKAFVFKRKTGILPPS